MHQLKALFKPLRVGGMELKNRLVMASIGGHGFCPEGWVTERLKNFYDERAKGGVGLIICNVSVRPLAGKLSGVAVHKDEYIPGLRELTRAVHAQGAKIAAQLFAQRLRMTPGGVLEVVGPSEYGPHRAGHPAPPVRPLTIEEIGQIVEEMGEKARRVREAGFDAIQIQATTGQTVVGHFMSPLVNRRTDRYGGSMENRYRLLFEILESARKRVGKDYPIIVRISGAEFLDGGATLEDTKMAAPMLEKAGFCAIDVSTGWHEAPVPFFQASVPQGAFVYLAEGVKKVVHIPVIGGTRVFDPVLADRLVAEGRVDLVYMARPIIAEPELPNKASEGRFDEIRPCIACGHCFDAIDIPGKSMTCAVNAQAGREAEYSIVPAAKPKKVFIVGGGPAGMEVARVAALRGHHVTLLERGDRLGGNLNLAAIPPFKQDIGHFLKYLTRQMELRGVEVKLNEEVTPEFIEQHQPDAVIVATGASALIPDIPGVKGRNVATALDVLAGARETGERVIIIGGGLVGCETAEFLAEKGRKVTILEMLGRIGNDITPSYRWVVVQRLREDDIRMETRTKAEEITDKGVRASQDGTPKFFDGDSVVLAVGFKPNDELLRQLPGKVAPLYSIGDCVEPHRIAEAVGNGFRVAREI